MQVIDLGEEKTSVVARCGPRAMLALTPKQREALRLTYWDGKTAAEAAALLGIPVPTLKSRIHGATTRLRELLDQRLI